MPPRSGTLLDLDAADSNGNSTTANTGAASNNGGQEGASGGTKDDDGNATEQIHQIITPSYSTWFDKKA